MALEGGPEGAGGAGGGDGAEDGLELEGGGGGGAVVIAAVGLGDPPQPVRMNMQQTYMTRERVANDLEILTNKLREFKLGSWQLIGNLNLSSIRTHQLSLNRNSLVTHVN